MSQHGPERAEKALPVYLRRGVAAAPVVSDEEYARSMAAAEVRMRESAREAKTRYWLSRLPEDYRQAEARRPETRKWVADYLKGERYPLVYFGGVGTGKTWEAMAIARTLLVEHTIPVSVATAPELLQTLRPNEAGVSDSGQYQMAPVLVLDDLGTEKATDWVTEQLYMIASFRAARSLPTVVTTNLKPADIHERYDARLVQRLFGGGVAVHLTGQSLRPMPF